MTSTSKPLTKKQDENSKLEEIKLTVQQIQDDIEEMKPKTGMKRIGSLLFDGIIRGLGMLIGTTIIAGAILGALYYIITSTVFMDFLGETINDAIVSAIQNALPF